MKNKKQKSIVHYDAKSDVLYLGAKSGIEEEFVEVVPGISIELDKGGKAIGIEVLNASKVMRPISKSLLSGGKVQRRESVLALR